MQLPYQKGFQLTNMSQSPYTMLSKHHTGKFKFLLKKSQLSNVSTEECLTAPHWDKIWIKSEREIARSQLFKLESWQNHRMQYKQTCLLSCCTFLRQHYFAFCLQRIEISRIRTLYLLDSLLLSEIKKNWNLSNVQNYSQECQMVN